MKIFNRYERWIRILTPFSEFAGCYMFTESESKSKIHNRLKKKNTSLTWRTQIGKDSIQPQCSSTMRQMSRQDASCSSQLFKRSRFRVNTTLRMSRLRRNQEGL